MTDQHMSLFLFVCLNVILRFDVQSKYAFVGDLSCHISVIKLSNNGFELITTLKGHTGECIDHICSGLPLVREKSGKFKVREKSGNFRI